jgi:hypothetical protein
VLRRQLKIASRLAATGAGGRRLFGEHLARFHLRAQP